MQKLNSTVTDSVNFYRGNNPYDLLAKYGSPLYVYNEEIIRKNCRELKNLVTYPKYKVNFSPKANSNMAILQIMRQEGLCVDTMSPGEIYICMKAGFDADKIFFVPNNVSEDEMRYAIERNINVSVDSLSQLEQYGRINSGGKVSLRINPGIGAGHHEKVVTAGKNTKFGINIEDIPQALELVKKYGLKVIGLNQHIGSLFMEGDNYVNSIKKLLEISESFNELEFIDMGGGFGVPYRKQEGEKRLDMKHLGEMLDRTMREYSERRGVELTFAIEPGRYVPAEASVILGKVHSVKNNGSDKYIGCDIGFNVLIRPTLYDAHHEIEVYRNSDEVCDDKEVVTVVGNICESGDILAKNRMLPKIVEGDVLAVLDTGSYCYSMSSTYNSRLRPAEVLIREDSSVVLIRERDRIEDLTERMISLF